MDQKKVKIKYREAPYYRRVGSTGIFGGPTPNGELLCNFFIESRVYPDEVEIQINDNGSTVENASYREKDLFYRELQFGVLLPPHTAKVIGEWLIRRADEMMKAFEKEPVH